MNEILCEGIEAAFLGMAMLTTDDTKLKNVRSSASKATLQVMMNIADEVRKLPTINQLPLNEQEPSELVKLEDVLFLLGQRL